MNTLRLSLKVLNGLYAICSLQAGESLPSWILSGGFYSLTRTPDELSIVCLQDLVPEEVKTLRGWKALKVEGRLDSASVGILSSLTSSLARAGITIFAISTYNTDYLLVKENELDQAVAALRKAGHVVGSS